MPEPDPKTGRACICIISSILFICIAAGGGCLLAYITLPESQSTVLLPVIGFTLVCMPWIFWIVTVIYRITSRAFGFRMVVGGLYGSGSVAPKGANDSSSGAAAAAGVNNIDGAQILDVSVKSPPSSPKNDAKSGDIDLKETGAQISHLTPSVEKKNRSSETVKTFNLLGPSNLPRPKALALKLPPEVQQLKFSVVVI
ncbi:hypothetical protein PTKIN_Ptkin07bG0097300 [Pterospermum kingtungense]